MGYVCNFAKGVALLFPLFLFACENSESVNFISPNESLVTDSLSSCVIGVPFSSEKVVSSSSQVNESSGVEKVSSYSSEPPQSSSSLSVIAQSSFSRVPVQSSSSVLPSLPNNGVPYIRIATADSANVDSAYVLCSVEIAGNGIYSDLAATSGKIRTRGNSTRLWYPKKPYRIKLDAKASVLGLPANKDWVLLANYRDQSKFMNAIAFDMARYMGSFAFVNANRFVEVEINGEYMGVYQLTEQIEHGTSRVNMGTGGVLLSLDQDDGPELSPSATNNFYSKVYKMPVAVKYPKNVTATQIDTISANLAVLEQAIANSDYDSVQKLMDISSFMDFLILQELTHNVELEAPRSMYLYKDSSGLYHMGPVWDFDGGFAYSWDEDTKKYFVDQDWILSRRKAVSGFFVNLFANKSFLADYKARWIELKSDILTDVFAKLDNYMAQAQKALENDAIKWTPVRSFIDEVQSLKSWLTERVNRYESALQKY